LPPVRTRRRKVVPVSLQQSLIDLLIVTVIAALAPIVAGLLSRLRVPQAVILIVGGILVGPQVLGWADPVGLELVSNVGLGFLFLLAGYELELRLFRERAGRLALTSWLVTLLVAIGVTAALAAVGFVRAFVPVAIGLTTTALGTLLPILRDNRMLGGRFGAFIMAAGAVGEFLPILAVAVFLSANGAFLGLLSLVVIGGARCCLPSSRGWHATRRSRESSPRVSTRRRRPPFAGPWSCSSLSW
jgi:Kef-type K+ transport system membrane component KefB